MTYRYSDTFKATAARLSQLPGVAERDVAESLHSHPFMLSRWRKHAREGPDRDQGYRGGQGGSGRAQGAAEGRRSKHIVPVIEHNPVGLFPQYRCHSHATEIRGDSRLLITSGLNGYLEDGTTLPESFEEQAEIIWGHIRTLLHSAGMDMSNLFSLRTYLADPKCDEASVRMRVKHLGTHEPSYTVVCCQLLDPRWKLEVEAMAAT